MKKFKLAAVALCAAAGLTSCNSGTSQVAKFETQADSISYLVGLQSFHPQLRSMLIQQFEDSTLVDDVIKGMQDGFNKATKKDKAYAAGFQTGQAIASDMIKGLSQQIFQDENADILVPANLMQAFIDLAQGKESRIENGEEYLEETMPKLIDKVFAEKYADQKKENEDFLAENATKEGVVTTESGLQYKILTEGSGATIGENQKVKLNYAGKLIDGTEFDKNENIDFDPAHVVKGFGEALRMMPKGSKWEIYIPQELGYGTQGAGAQIKPYSTLIFTVEVLDFVDNN